MNNNHEFNSYDKIFLKSLNYGDLIPIAVMKNYDDKTKEAFEKNVEIFLDCEGDDAVNFGNVSVGDNDYFVVATNEDILLKHMINHSYSLNQAMLDVDKNFKFGVFDYAMNIKEAGVAPLICFEIRSEASEREVKSLISKLSSPITKLDAFELFVTSLEGKKVINYRQKSEGRLLFYETPARALALNILSEYRESIQNIYGMDIDGKIFDTRIKKKSFDFAQKKKDIKPVSYKETCVSQCTSKYDITQEDLREILECDFGSNRVVASVMKNPEATYEYMRRVCNETKSARDADCEVISMLGKNGDKFVLFVVDADFVAEFDKDTVRLEQKLLKSSGKSYSINMYNIDNLGMLMSAKNRLVGRVHTGSAYRIKMIEKGFASQELFAKFKPEVVQYDENDYNIFIKNYRDDNKGSRTQIDKAIKEISATVKECGLHFEATDAHGDKLPKKTRREKVFVNITKKENTAEEQNVEKESSQVKE